MEELNAAENGSILLQLNTFTKFDMMRRTRSELEDNVRNWDPTIQTLPMSWNQILLLHHPLLVLLQHRPCQPGLATPLCEATS